MTYVGIAVGILLLVAGMVKLWKGTDGRSVCDNTITGNVYMGEVTTNIGTTIHNHASPPAAPQRGLFDWSAWLLTAGGFLLGAVSLYLTIYPTR
jgi:hypothetical protein